MTVALPGSGATALSPGGTREIAPTSLALPGRLQVGMRLEVLPGRLISPESLEARLRPLEGNLAWSTSVRAQLTTPLPANVLQPLLSGPGAGLTSAQAPRLQAEVVSISPSLVLRIVSLTDPSAPSLAQTPAAGSREWLGQQFRLHWPESRSLTSTLTALTSRPNDGAEPAEGLSRLDPTVKIQVERTLTALVGQLATPRDLTNPERLAAAIGRSGIWLEARIAQSATSPMPAADLTLDLKAQLLTLAHRIRTSQPGEGLPARASPNTTNPTPTETVSANTRLLPLDAPDQTASRQEPHRIRTGEPAENLPTRASSNTTNPPPAETASANTRQPPLDEPGRTTSRQEPPPETVDPKSARPPTQEVARGAGLAREVDGMIKQVVTQQLQTLDSTPGQTHWVLELPFRTTAGLLALEADIRREQTGESSEEDAWSMRIRLDLPRLGPLNILLSLRAERLHASLQAGEPASAERIRRHLDELRTQLEAREIEVASLHAGYRPAERPEPPFQSPLLREQA
ncbi:flagellar hook-length control protein FliK [Thiocystis violacea]|uniref:flagellar hook-length control protein FliK n=1 Tax=Thiocystis violacea TaxID=13725 RepID=UPI0019046AF4|nr:flagellar hook-length control protein FliK [Thiocystis violacea]